MAAISVATLDEYSRVAVPMILARFPEWEPFAKRSPQCYGQGNTVEFNIPCPSTRAVYGLWVSTAEEELSVGFHTHHLHFTDYENRLNVKQIEAGIQCAVDIIEERVGVVSWYRKGTFIGSRSVDLPHTGQLPGLFDGFDSEMLSLVAGMSLDSDQVTLRSWLGTFDREEVRA